MTAFRSRPRTADRTSPGVNSAAAGALLLALALAPEGLARAQIAPSGPAAGSPRTAGTTAATSAPPAETGPVAQLPELLESARRRSRRVGIARAELEQSMALIGRARGVLTPSLAVTATYTRNQFEAVAAIPGAPPVIIQPNNQLDASINLNVPLFDGAAWSRLRSANLSSQVSRESLRATEDEVLLMVTRLYLQAVAAQERLRSTVRAEAANREDLAYSQARRAAGAATELTVDRSKLEVARAEQQTIEAQRVLAQTLRNMATLSGSPEAARVASIPVELTPPDAEGPRVDNALRVRPEARSSRLNVEVARQAQSEARWAFVPTLGFAFNERFTNATGFAGQEAIYTLTLTMRWQFDLIKWADLKVNAAQARVAEERLNQTKDDVRDAVHNARLDVLAGISSVKAAREGERVAAKAAEIARVQFRLGAATQRDVIDGERDRVRAEAERAQSESDLVYSRLALERASGHPLLPAAQRELR